MPIILANSDVVWFTHAMREAHKVSLTSDSVIRVNLIGDVSARSVEKIAKESLVFAEKLRSNNKPVRILVDLSRTGREDSQARVAAKQFLRLKFDRIAFYGASPELSRTVLYLIRSVGRLPNVRYFQRYPDARRWLGTGKKIGFHHKGARVISALIGLAGTALSMGWLLIPDTLERISSRLALPAPLTSVYFVVFAIILWQPTLSIYKDTVQRINQALLATVTIISLVVAAVYIADPHDAPMSFGSAVNFFLLGIAMIDIRNARGKRSRWIAESAVVLSFISLIVFLFGHIYGTGETRAKDDVLYISIISLVLFYFVIWAFILLNHTLHFSRRASRISRTAGLGVILFLLIHLLTAAGWRETVVQQRNNIQSAFQRENENLEHRLTFRLNAYINALHGFRALFTALEVVTQEDFHNYFVHNRLADVYPGVTTVTFIKYVPSHELTNYFSTYPHVSAVLPEANSKEYYILTYAESLTGQSATFGLDLRQDPQRNTNLESARQLGEPVASNTINLTSSVINPDAPSRSGFFMTIPVFTQGADSANQGELFGFVNAVFEYDSLFTDTLADQIEPHMYVAVFNDSGQPAYTHQPTNLTVQEDWLKHTASTNIGNHEWKIETAAPPNFSLPELENNLQGVILSSGFIVAFLLGGTVINQSRSRQQAVTLAQHITEDLRNERNFALETQRKSEAVLSSIADGVVVTDNHGRITLFNPAAQALTGFTEAEALHQPYDKILSLTAEGTKKINGKLIDRVWRTGKSYNATHVLTRKDGREIYVADSVAPIRLARRAKAGTITVLRDITKERELDKTRSEFISIASHELRTPATAVKTFIGLLKEGFTGELSPRQSEYVNLAYESNERELQIINDLLFVARSDEGRIVLHRETVDVNAFLQEIVRDFQTPLRDRQQKLELKLPAKPVTANLDRQYFRMAVSNLISNANKYTQVKGKIAVVLASNSQTLSVSVHDNGVGIAKSDLRKLFRKFSRISNVLSIQAGGTGLGLYLTRQVVHLHGGKLEVWSEPGKGSTFTVVVPTDA